tara:strand:- start:96 stop:263 length:168 start_codon:yes stop_codon:yes gene_type:complete
MINAGREWDWMDEGVGVFISPPKVPRAFSTKVSNESNLSTNQTTMACLPKPDDKG